MELTQIEKKLPEIEASRWPPEKNDGLNCKREIDDNKKVQCAIADAGEDEGA